MDAPLLSGVFHYCVPYSAYTAGFAGCPPGHTRAGGYPFDFKLDSRFHLPVQARQTGGNDKILMLRCLPEVDKFARRV